MKVVHVSTSATRGGAARAMLRLHLGLLKANCESSIFALDSTGDAPCVRGLSVPQGNFARLRRKFLRAMGHGRIRPPTTSHDSFSDDRSIYSCEVEWQLPRADVTHLHWTTGFIATLRFFRYCSTPVVWTLHDMNPFTGGCHYSEGCDRFNEVCGHCPQLDSQQSPDASSAIQGRKALIHGAVSAGKLVVVAPSSWMADSARRSTIMRSFTIEVIPYGVDLERFRPIDRTAAREELGLPPNACVLFFCADYQTPRKGIIQLFAALQQLCTIPKLVLLSVGDGAPVTELPVEHRRLGRLDDDEMIARAYAAADLFVIPSLEDNLPNTVLESIACGTPVVGFAAGGIPEAIGESGVTVPVGDVNGLATAARALLADEPLRIQLGKAARARAEKHYSAALQASRYVALYERLMAAQARNPFNA